MSKTAAARRFFARQEIEELAAQARARYLSAVLGPDIVYLAKAAQARAYVASHPGGVGTELPGPYIVAEAEATGLSRFAAAEAIVAAADEWENIVGPRIEKARIKARLRIKTALSEEELADITSAAADAFGQA